MQELLDRSSNQLSVRGEASSKFLSVDGFGGGNADIGGGGHQNRVPPTARTMAEDVARALGMPHPLYRSSSIVGKLARGVGGVFESAANVQRE